MQTLAIILFSTRIQWSLSREATLSNKALYLCHFYYQMHLLVPLTKDHLSNVAYNFLANRVAEIKVNVLTLYTVKPIFKTT